jgi:hypothetical protein
VDLLGWPDNKCVLSVGGIFFPSEFSCAMTGVDSETEQRKSYCENVGRYELTTILPPAKAASSVHESAYTPLEKCHSARQPERMLLTKQLPAHVYASGRACYASVKICFVLSGSDTLWKMTLSGHIPAPSGIRILQGALSTRVVGRNRQITSERILASCKARSPSEYCVLKGIFATFRDRFPNCENSQSEFVP